MRLREYLAALWADWMGLMSGVASVLLAFWAAYYPPANLQAGRTLLWVSAVACFVLASYRIWVKEHNAALAKKAELEAVIADLRARLDETAKRGEVGEKLKALYQEGSSAL